MSNKKKQHIIPKCYLKNFLSDDIPEKYRNNNNFEKNLYYYDKIKSSWEMKSIGKNSTFTENCFYDFNYSSDDQNQFIENAFNIYENVYNKNLQKITDLILDYKIDNDFNDKELKDFIYFITILIQRTHYSIEHNKEKISKLINTNHDEEITEIISRCEIFDDSITNYAINKGFAFLYNQTNIPLISSDKLFASFTDVSFIIILSPKICFWINPPKSNIILKHYNIIINEEFIKKINKSIYLEANKFIISNIKYEKL